MNAVSFTASLIPGAASTPVATSTHHGSTAWRIAAATVLGVEPAGEHELALRVQAMRLGGERVIEAHAGAAALRSRRVEHDRIGRPHLEVLDIARVRHRERLPHRPLRRGRDRLERARILVAVDLDRIERELARDRDDVVELGVDEHADELRRARAPRHAGDDRRARRIEVALAARPEVEADEVDAGRRHARRVVGQRHAADLDLRGHRRAAQREQRLARRRCAHQVLADQHRVRARIAHPAHVRGGADPTLGDEHAARRYELRDLLGQRHVDRERAQIAVIDADQRRRHRRADRDVRLARDRGPRPAPRARRAASRARGSADRAWTARRRSAAPHRRHPPRLVRSDTGRSRSPCAGSAAGSHDGRRRGTRDRRRRTACR